MTATPMPGVQELNTEVKQLFSTTHSNPRVIRLAIRMRDMIDEAPLKEAVSKAAQRYPYLCVRLEMQEGQLVLARNRRDVPIFHSPDPHPLAGAEAGYHLIAFSWWNNWIYLDVFHGLSDGTGAYALVRTLLWYYCEARYGLSLEGEHVRLLGEPIAPSEWKDPTLRDDLPHPPAPVEREAAFDLLEDGGLGPKVPARDFAISIPEAEFMRFNVQNDGSPATMISLLLCRAVERLYPERVKPLRVNLCVNQRPALGAPNARHNLVGMATLEYHDGMRSWPIARQGTIFRGQTLVKTLEGRVLAGVAAQRSMAQRLMGMESNAERASFSSLRQGALRPPP